MSKLHRIKVEVEIYWVGSVPDSTDYELGEAVAYELGEGNGIRSFSVVKADDISQFDLASRPWGDSGGKTIQQWLEEDKKS